jgi:hypothetical protein
MTLTLTERERKVLILILSVDLDALGVVRSDQGPARSVLKRLKKATAEKTEDQS